MAKGASSDLVEAVVDVDVGSQTPPRDKVKNGSPVIVVPEFHKPASTKGGKSKKVKRKLLERPYPVKTLKEALVIPSKIKEVNNGNPWSTEDVAKACGYSNVRTGTFFYLSQAAREYGLTVGSYNTEKIGFSDLGKEILYASNAESELKNKIEAFFQIEIFKKVFDYYGGSSKLPEQPFLGNTLTKEFSLDSTLHEEFVKLFKTNCAFLNIENGLSNRVNAPSGRGHRVSLGVEDRSDVQIVGQPKTEFDLTAFVIMPFSEKGASPRPHGFFDEVLKSLITPAGNAAGFAIETATRRGSDVIQSTIINQLLEADLVICDLTDHNPNVLFELGIRIAKGIPVALIRAEGTGPIFDVDHLLRVLPYSPNIWPGTVSQDLPKLKEHFAATWENRSKTRSYIEILTDAHPQTSP